MSGERESLAMPSFDELDDFAPRGTMPERPSVGQGPDRRSDHPGSEQGMGQAERYPHPGQGASAPAPRRSEETRRAIDAVSQFPSREASNDGQLNLKGPRPILDRFRAMCKADRRAYYDMLEILMDSYEGRAR